MCGDTLKAALRVNREIADKKNEAIFAAKRAKMGDIEPSTGGKATATASATATATATAAEPSGCLLLISSDFVIGSKVDRHYCIVVLS
jgi:mannose-1-phosphate guanylyltransferase